MRRKGPAQSTRDQMDHDDGLYSAKSRRCSSSSARTVSMPWHRPGWRGAGSTAVSLATGTPPRTMVHDSPEARASIRVGNLACASSIVTVDMVLTTPGTGSASSIVEESQFLGNSRSYHASVWQLSRPASHRSLTFCSLLESPRMSCAPHEYNHCCQLSQEWRRRPPPVFLPADWYTLNV